MRAVLAVLAGLAASAVAAPAQAATSISLYSDPGEWIGQGTRNVFHAGNTRELGAHMYDGHIVAWANGPGEDDSFSFEFAAPYGEPLEPRNYIGVQRLPFRESGRPGMELFGGSRGCNQVSGRFELRDLVTNAAGDIVRLWLFYEHHCEGSPRAAWGEIRVGAPAEAGTDATAPGKVRWPPLDSWRTATPAPVLYLGGSPIASAALAGEGAANFELDASGCLGRAGPCEVVVRYAPVVAGAREATLRLADAGGAMHETALEGFSYGGTTSATIEVLPGDVASEPGTYTYGPSNAVYGGQTYDPETSFFVSGSDGRWFNGRFGAGGGTPLTPGSYGPADSWFSSGPWLSVHGTELMCNASGGDFTVHEISRLPDGNLHTFDVSFEQDCYDDHRAAHRGRMRYRAGATAPLPDWMTSGPRPVIPPPPGIEQPGTGGAGGGSSAGAAPGTGGGVAASSGSSAAIPAATGPAARPRVRARWRMTRAGTRVATLVVTAPAAATRVQIRCTGRRCPFARRAVPLRAGRADLRPALRRAVLRPGAVLQVRVLRGTRALAQVRYLIRRGRAPRAICPGPSGPPCLR